MTSDTKEGLQRVHDFTVERDGKARAELDAAISALKGDFERLEAAGRPSQPTPGPGLGKMGAAFDNLQAQVSAATDSLEKLRSEVAAGSTRVEVLTTSSTLAYTETQASLQALGAIVAQLQALYHSGGPVPAPAPTSAADVDPMADGRDSWSKFCGTGPATPVFASAALGGRPQSVPIHTLPTLDPPRSNGR